LFFSLWKDHMHSLRRVFLLLFICCFIFNNSSANDDNNNDKEKLSSNPEKIILDAQFIKEGVLTFHDKTTSGIIIQIDIEIADSPDKLSTGLMYRRSLPDSAGMLFVLKESKLSCFWMKNTYIPLDIIFADENMEIITIQKNTTPLSEEPIPSKGYSMYVIEVKAGFCDKHRIKIGDFIKFSKT